jgi:hypothetical protein
MVKGSPVQLPFSFPHAWQFLSSPCVKQEGKNTCSARFKRASFSNPHACCPAKDSLLLGVQTTTKEYGGRDRLQQQAP